MSIASHNEIMGKSGPAFEKIIDDISWKIKHNGEFEMTNHNALILSGRFGQGFSKAATIRDSENKEVTQIKWGNDGETTVRKYEDKRATCLNIVSRSYNTMTFPTDCIDLKRDSLQQRQHLYGGAESYLDRWPIRFMPHTFPHVSDYGGYGSVLERYWFTSLGVGIFVENDVPLYLRGDREGTSLCFIAKYKGEIYRNQDTGTQPVLNYTVCAKGNVLDIHRYMSERFIKKPLAIPDERMITYPVWSTWVQFKSMITQDQTVRFVDNIIRHKFPASQIEIDDMYMTKYGDYEFDVHKFPKPKKMLDYIHSKGFRITVWTHPFANVNSDAFTEGRNEGYFVMDEDRYQVGVQKWWRGRAASLDVTNPAAVAWFFKRLAALHALGVDGHKYDAGEIGYLPARYSTQQKLRNPCEYSTRYAEAMYNNTNRFMQVRVGYKTQHLPIFVSMMDRQSSWSEDNGLRSVIATSLILSSIGYVFVMPDMIGGNAYCRGDMDCQDNRPGRELYIRWTQLAAFLPMMQFSIPPWEYDDEVTSIARRYVSLHADYIAPKIIALAELATRTGEPIIRPMWWSAPDDPQAWNLGSQFMVGDDVVVAPILDPQATSRRLYLPQGVWKDMNSGRIIDVDAKGYFIDKHPATLEQIPYFERVLVP